jgi:hypothetical protein
MPYINQQSLQTQRNNRVIHKVCQTKTTWGFWAPSFAGTGDEMRSKNTIISTQGEKRGTKLVVSSKSILRGVSPPVLDLPQLRLIRSQVLPEEDLANLLNWYPV